MSEQERKALVNAGALWIREDGAVTGDVEIGGVKVRASVVPVEKGDNANLPDFRLTLEGGLWKAKEGSKASLTGAFGKKDNQIRILVFENEKRGNEKAPDYRIVLEENLNPVAKEKPKAAPAQASIGDDENPPF